MFIYASDKMQRIKEMIDQVADTDVTVLILGESGVGKEVVARHIHENSFRRDRPFMKVNCAALPQELLESELFGYEKGAFTGACRKKPGKFELTDGGTIFLDEIAEIPLSPGQTSPSSPGQGIFEIGGKGGHPGGCAGTGSDKYKYGRSCQKRTVPEGSVLSA